jgi:SWI/SNF-related matrix-associated actin-dependent regulator 1 of chromatin subfamily A
MYVVVVLQLTGSSGELSGIAMMMHLRKMANHPALLRYYFTDGQLPDMARRLAADRTYKETNPEYIVQDLAMMSDYQIHQLSSVHKVRCSFHFVFVSAMTEQPLFCSC